jgi:hypothetical protein
VKPVRKRSSRRERDKEIRGELWGRNSNGDLGDVDPFTE